MMKFSVLCYFLIGISLYAQDSIPVSFYYGDLKANKVSVTGSFNNWDSKGIELTKGIEKFSGSINLLPGYYYYKFIADGKWINDPENRLKVNDGGEGFNSIIKVGEPPIPKRKLVTNFLKDKLPIPFLRNDEGFIDLYYAAWQMALSKLKQGNVENGFVDVFMDEGFNEMIYQWDTNFMVLFGMYVNNVFPAIQSLDNFYLKQRDDGYIQRVYSEKTGLEATEPTKDEPMVNPPLFAYTELQYYHFTGDSSRIPGVLPILIKYFNWLDKNCKSTISANLYYNTPLGSGMDNIPRDGVGKGAYADFSIQMALFANSLKELLLINGNQKLAKYFNDKFFKIRLEINKNLLKNGFYYDMKEDKTLSKTKYAGAFWALLADIADVGTITKLRGYLNDTLTFKRPHMIPALSADDPEYDSNGHYWKGGVWAPINYATIKGLEKKGYSKEAYNLAYNHVNNMYKTYKYFNADTNRIPYEERYGDDYKTIWECYSPEFLGPATRWDNTFYSRQDFVGWSGLGAISLLIENIIGIRIKGSENTIYWNINREDMHGVLNLPLRKQKVSLVLNLSAGKFTVRSGSESPYNLVISFKGKKYKFTAGKEQEEVFELN